MAAQFLNGNPQPQAFETPQGFAVGKPVVVEETFPLRCSIPELEQISRRSAPPVSGWLGFYWGRTIEEYRALPNASIGDALTLGWLGLFQTLAHSTDHRETLGSP